MQALKRKKSPTSDEESEEPKRKRKPRQPHQPHHVSEDSDSNRDEESYGVNDDDSDSDSDSEKDGAVGLAHAISLAHDLTDSQGEGAIGSVANDTDQSTADGGHNHTRGDSTMRLPTGSSAD